MDEIHFNVDKTQKNEKIRKKLQESVDEMSEHGYNSNQ